MKCLNRPLIAVFLLLTVILWVTVHPTQAKAQNETASSLFASLADTGGYELNKPFQLNISVPCGAEQCPAEVVLQLPPSVEFVDAHAPNQLTSTRLDRQSQQLFFMLNPIGAEQQVAVQTTLVIHTKPESHPIIQIGIDREDGIDWIDEVPLFPAVANPQPAPAASKLPQEPDIFLRSDFEFGDPNLLELSLAPANRSGGIFENLTLITNLPDGAYVAQIDPGWYRHIGQETALPTLEVSYQITDTWRTWSISENLNSANQLTVANPFLGPSEEDPEIPISLFDTPAIKAIKFEYRSVPPHFRWGSSRSSQPKIQLDLAPRLLAEWIELCTAATSTKEGDDAGPSVESCAQSRTQKPVSKVQNFDFWVNTNFQNRSPELGDKLELTPALVTSASDNQALDLIIELPNWLAFNQVINDLGYFPIVDGVPADVIAQPIFEERVAIETGTKRLHWRWPADRPLSDLPLPVIQTTVQAAIPTGVQTIPATILSDSLSNCWGERPSGRDFLDMDLDENRQELLCQVNVPVGIRPIAGLAANLRLPNTISPGVPFAADFDIINGGNQPLNQINTAVALPKGWLTAPPIAPKGVAIAYSTSSDLCAGAADCDSANWQAGFPTDRSEITALKLSGMVGPILAGEQLTTRLFLQPPATSDTTLDKPWPSTIVSGASDNGEIVEFRYQAEALTWGNDPQSLIGGRVFADSNQNGILEDGEAGIAEIPVALVSPGGDGKPATADDRILAWSRSDESGQFRFGYSLAGSYYLATQPTRTSFAPTRFTGDPDTTTEPITRFSADTWRTGLIPLPVGETDETVHLALLDTVKTTLSGVVAVDENQNEQWDDPQSAGQNGVSIELIDQSGNVLASTQTQTDGYGRPGRFLMQMLETVGPDGLSLRFTYATPFIGSAPSSQAPHQLTVPINSQRAFEVLVRETPQGFDIGDAPISYGVSYHRLSSDLTIGLISDSDTPSTQSQINATSDQQDDQTELDDEEGVFFKNGNLIQSTAGAGEVVVVMRNEQEFAQNLNGWIDFNGDGFFENSEKIITNYRLYPRSNPQAMAFSYSIPKNVVCGNTYARFRLGEGERPDGVENTGEVEDLPFEIDCVTDLAIALEPESTPIGPNELSRWFVYVSNEGESPAENVTFNITIPGPFIYQGLVSLTNDPVACTDIDTARVTQTITCQIPELSSGQALTLSLSYFLPFDTEARTVDSIATVTSDTTDSNLENNLASRNVKIEKTWLLLNPTYEAFTHVSLFPGLVLNNENREGDFKQSTSIATVINTPISITIGVDTNRMPILTVQSCIDNPDDPTCNSTNIVEGQVIQESYTIERIFFEDDLIFEPEEPESVRLNRISDPNMARCGALGSCVGFDLFRVGRGDIRPYAWNAPDDYFYLAFFTNGGRIVRCPEEGYENRCFIQSDAKPGTYEVEGVANIKLIFQDTRLGPDPVEIDRVLQFRSIIRVVAPFIEPER